MDNSQQEEVFPFIISEESAPHIADSIFKRLDQNALVKCRLVSNVWKGFVDCHTSLWGTVSLHQYLRAAKEVKLSACRLIIENVQDKNPADVDGQTPLHEFAAGGHLELCRLIIKNLQNCKNPANKNRQTPLHFAAREGHLKVCRLIMENVEDKNPADRRGQTPLHEFAARGHLELCRLIFDHLQEEKPVTYPLH